MTSDAVVEIEDRYTALDSRSTTKQEGTISYVEITATDEGSTIVPLNLSFGQRTSTKLIGLKIRTQGIATLELSKEKTLFLSIRFRCRIQKDNGDMSPLICPSTEFHMLRWMKTIVLCI